ncbi:hypothetical protein GYMC52_0337 [Geobacillus sp. Y412MC52]|nr:hypothetical protein GYMC52_0337 [Geobacillus sp. Y412MC52]
MDAMLERGMRDMQRNTWLITIGKRRQGWSSLYTRPVDIGGAVVFHPPFRCFAAIRSKVSYQGSLIMKEEMTNGHDAI